MARNGQIRTVENFEAPCLSYSFTHLYTSTKQTYKNKNLLLVFLVVFVQLEYAKIYFLSIAYD